MDHVRIRDPSISVKVIITATLYECSAVCHSSLTMLPYLVLVVISLFLYFKFFKQPKHHLSNVNDKYIFITGCDSGFGRQTAIRLDRLGFHVVATCLTEDGKQSLCECCSNRLRVLLVDITDHCQVQAAFEEVSAILKDDQGKEII